jgi:hypothetical protein
MVVAAVYLTYLNQPFGYAIHEIHPNNWRFIGRITNHG